MDMSGMASSTVVMTIIALGAGVGVAVEPEGGYVPPQRLTHRGPPGPAQIELAQSAPSTPRTGSGPKESPPLVMSVSETSSSPCDGASTTETVGPETLACALSSLTLQPIARTGAENLLLAPVTK